MAKRSAFDSLPLSAPLSDLNVGSAAYILVPHLEPASQDPWRIIPVRIKSVKPINAHRDDPLCRLEVDHDYLRKAGLALSGRLPLVHLDHIYRNKKEAAGDKAALSRFEAPTRLQPSLPSNKKRFFKHLGGFGLYNLH